MNSKFVVLAAAIVVLIVLLSGCPKPPYCGDGNCNFKFGENSKNCPEDCEGQSYCGDGFCDPTENADTCLVDCKENPVVCGDGVCQPGEDPSDCCMDCGCTAGKECKNNVCVEISGGVKPYPFEGGEMFFGWSIIGKEKIPYAQDLDMKWASLQPHAIWFQIEQEPYVYDWEALDKEIKWLQELDVDITIVHSYFYNTFDSSVRDQIKQELLDIVAANPSLGIGGAFIAWNRDYDGPNRYGIVADPLDEEDELMPYLEEFVKACAERYDGDGVDDMPGLKYAVRVHHVVEEWPSPKMNAQQYLGYLQKLSPAIKQTSPEAKVMIPGLYMPNIGRLYAYMNGYIDDPDAGVKNGVKYTKEELEEMNAVKWGKAGYEGILEYGKDYFDLVDLHLYVEKETFIEGEIQYVQDKMAEFGYQRPIYCVEGGGPFKNPPEDPNNPQGDTYFGAGTYAENAEFVVKLHAMSAAKGLYRQHWGIGGGEGGYWQGPWDLMPLLGASNEKKPSYYTYKIMREELRDFEIGNVNNLSTERYRVFEFDLPTKKVYVAWNPYAESETYEPINLSSVLPFGEVEVEVTYIVTELDQSNNPVERASEALSSTEVPISLTPVFIEAA